jgi:hypothetical protein
MGVLLSPRRFASDGAGLWGKCWHNNENMQFILRRYMVLLIKFRRDEVS